MQLWQRTIRILAVSFAVTLFTLSGCSAPQKGSHETWVDLGEISSAIKKAPPKDTVVEGSISEVKKDEPGSTKQPVAIPEGGDNPYLTGLTAKAQDATPAIEGEGILLNFDNADIYEVIQSIAEILEMNYIIDPQVKGVVNIRSGKKIPMNKILEVFKKILHINGLDIRSEGEYEYIYMARKAVSPVIKGPEELGSLTESPKVIMQIIPVMHLSSDEAIKLIEPYLSEQGNVYNLTNQNTIIVQDFESKVLDCVMILSRLDISPLATLKMRLIRVDNASLFDLRDEMEEIMTAMKIDKKENQGVSIVPLERVNSLLLVSNNDFILESIEAWIKQLDIVPSQGRDNIYIYNVRNSVASELGELVNSLISENMSGATGAKKTPGTPETPPANEPAQTGSTTKKSPAKPKTTAKTTKKTAAAAGPTSSALNFVGEPMLLADDSRNIILIRALPPDYSRIQKLLERLDNMPRQVLIEVLVAEITLTDAFQFGIEWYVKNHNMNINGAGYLDNFITNFSQVSPPATDDTTEDPIGFTYSLLSNNSNVFALLNALASDSNVSILSSPQIMVLNNEAAYINVGKEVPIVTTETLRDNVTNNVDRQVQYKDTGVILSVTPRINYDGIIILDVDQEISEARTNTTGGIDSPEILKRQVKTKLAVKDGQAVLIGGLISSNQDMADTGLPYIKDAPLLGWLFKYQAETTSKTELLIMITPYVIESEDVLDQYINEFKKQVSNLKKGMK